MKVYTDASHIPDTSQAWASFCRHDGVSARPIEAADSTEAEYKAINIALKHLQNEGKKNVQIYSDSRTVIRRLRNKQLEGPYEPLVGEILGLSNDLKVSFRWIPREENKNADRLCRHKRKEMYYVGDTKFKTISLPKLDKLTPTLEGTMMKIMEETGELAQCIGKYRGVSGEKISKEESELAQEISAELLDVAQSAITMMFVMEEKYGINMDDVLKHHWEKMRSKGYMS